MPKSKTLAPVADDLPSAEVLADEGFDLDRKQTAEPVGRLTATIIAILGSIGLFASLTLINEKIKKLSAEASGDEFTASCDLSAWLSCSSVLDSAQSEVFGFPNPFLGIVGFTVVVVAAVVLFNQGHLPRIFWIGLQAGVLFAGAFITWLQVQSLGPIGRLCPYCVVVWVVTIPLVVIISRLSLSQLAPGSSAARLLQNWSPLIMALWYIGVVSAIWFAFGTRLWA